MWSAGRAHDLGQPGVRHQVAVLAVHGHEPLRLGQRVEQLELLGLGVAGGVHVGEARVDDLGAVADRGCRSPWLTSCSLPGIGMRAEKITVSSGVSFSQRFSIGDSSVSADIGSPCEPVQITHT